MAVLGDGIALCSAAAFGAANTVMRQAQNKRPKQSGMITTTLVNTVIGTVLVAGVFFSGNMAPGTWLGLGIFIVAGLFTTLLGRTFLLACIRVAGPSRAVAYKALYPVVTVAIAVSWLNERLGWLTVLGAAFVIGGLIFLSTERKAPAPSGAGEVAAAREAVPLAVRLQHPVVLGVACAISFGVGQALRKVAILQWNAPILGALIGSALAFAAVSSGEILTADPEETGGVRLRELRPPLAMFVFAGVLMSIGQITTYYAYQQSSATTASVLLSTDPVFTVLSSYFLLRGGERLSLRVLVAIAITMCGTALVVAG